MQPKFFLIFIYLAVSAIAQADPGIQAFLEQALATAREKNHLPAIAGLIQIDGKTAAEAALGVRALGHPEAVTVHDRWRDHCRSKRLGIGADVRAWSSKA